MEQKHESKTINVFTPSPSMQEEEEEEEKEMSSSQRVQTSGASISSKTTVASSVQSSEWMNIMYNNQIESLVFGTSLSPLLPPSSSSSSLSLSCVLCGHPIGTHQVSTDTPFLYVYDPLLKGCVCSQCHVPFLLLI